MHSQKCREILLHSLPDQIWHIGIEVKTFSAECDPNRQAAKGLKDMIHDLNAQQLVVNGHTRTFTGCSNTI